MTEQRRNDDEPALTGGPLGPGPGTPDLFTHGPPSGKAATGDPSASPAATVEAVETVEKPWGHEEVFGVLEGRYAGKILHIRAGCSLSLQRHVLKDETLSVRSGQVTIEHGADAGQLETSVLGPGRRLLVRAGTVHRVTASEDSEVLEVSTAWPGWRLDIVRLHDGYGRAGTCAP